MLGWLTAIRPLVMIAGVTYGIYFSRLLETRLLGMFVLLLMLSLEFALNRRADRRQDREIHALV
jgi:4-hydroxybenzoate polyprenyltransferase